MATCKGEASVPHLLNAWCLKASITTELLPWVLVFHLHFLASDESFRCLTELWEAEETRSSAALSSSQGSSSRAMLSPGPPAWMSLLRDREHQCVQAVWQPCCAGTKRPAGTELWFSQKLCGLSRC